MTVKMIKFMKIKLLMAFLSLIFILSCVEEFKIEIKNDQDYSLVIEGRITNKPGPYIMKLSTSTSLAFPEFVPLTGAIVQIADNEGNSETLTEEEPGIYKTSESGIRGIIGRSYKIMIQTKTGNQYESEFEELLAPVGIESVTVQRETQFAQNADTDYEEGFQFYISTETSVNPSNFYYWELEETYEIRSEWEIVLIYNGHQYGNDYGDMRNFRPPSSRDTLFYCWNTQMRDKKFTNNTTHFSTPKINNSPLSFVSFTDEKLKYKYSLLVNQLTISEDTYTYLNALFDQDASQEGLYSNQPYHIQGNVISKTKPEESVLGYFIVAGMQNGKRLTVVPPPQTKKWKSPCNVDALFGEETPEGAFPANSYSFSFSDIDRGYYRRPEDWPIYITSIPVPNTERDSIIVMPLQSCLDCTKRSGVTNKPDYWDQ